MLIGLSGKGRSGKDTVGKIFGESDSVLTLALADNVKFLARILFGWDGAKDESGRKLLIDIGMKMREIDEDVWVKNVFTGLHPSMRSGIVVITDIRYRNEAEWIRKEGGILVRVIREELPDDNAEWRLTQSETDLDDWTDWDYEIKAGTIKELKAKAYEVRSKIFGNRYGKLHTSLVDAVNNSLPNKGVPKIYPLR